MLADQTDVLSRHGISALCGFLPDQAPIKRLPQLYYQSWECFMDNMSTLITNQEVRACIDNMCILDASRLSSEGDWMRAYLILSFMTHAYIWTGEEPSQKLPPSICRPYLEVAEHFDLPCTATYAALNLWNWRLRRLDTDLTSPENIQMLHTFTGTYDEEWFYAISVSIEAEGAKILPTMMECFEAVRLNKSIKVAQLLERINSHLVKLGKILDRMHESCDPHIFYHRIRPYLAGSKGMASVGLLDGVFYDEGDGKGVWRQYSGGSNAQSSLIQLLDIMLGVQHHASGNTLPSTKPTANKPKHGYIQEMRRYMPRQHRLFLQHVSDTANIREYATQSDAGSHVQSAYIQAVDSLTTFRDKHINIVARYIVAPSRVASAARDGTGVNIATVSTRQGSDDPRDRVQLCGTGGTQLMPFLKQTRDETKATGVLRDA